MHVPVRPRRRLMWKYVVVLVSLVAAGLLASGLTEAYFSYQDNKKSLSRVQYEKASSAADSIDQFLSEVRRQIGDVAGARADDRRVDYQRLLDRERFVTGVTYLDASARQQLRLSPFDVTQGRGPDYSGKPRFVVARAKGTYYGPVYFQGGSRPYMKISVKERPPGRGVVVAEIDLESVRDVIVRTRVGSAGYAYAVDSRGQLIAHPNINLVLGRADLAALPQVRAALEGSAKPAASVRTGRNHDGKDVLSAFQTVDPPGWRVFVEEPLSVAYSPLESALVRTALLLVAFLVLAVGTSVLLARRMVRPITSMQSAAAKIGEGALAHRIDVTRKDELGMLGEEFNRMAARLQESYASLEDKVEERTRELETALAELDEKSHQLETVSRHKSEFLANMSHELRTPLNAIIGFSEVLREQMFGELNEQQLSYVDDVLEAGRHLHSLINDILDLSKIEAGRMELELTEVSLPETLRSGLTMHEGQANQTGVTFGLAVDPDEIVLQADERKLRQVVFNLLSNAVKFTPPGGHVDVTAQMADGVVEVAVADTGSGIALDDQELIFEVFQQARGADAGERPEGTGLGLPLARKFIELHGGRLWVESASGRGSTFRFTLPTRQGA